MICRLRFGKKSWRDGRAVSSNLATALILSLFVGLVVIGLTFAYVLPSMQGQAQGSSGITLSDIVLYSGTASFVSYNQTCGNGQNRDAELQIYLANNSNKTVDITNISLYAGSPIQNGTALIPISNGCVPVSQTAPPIPADQNDFEVDSYPNIQLPITTECKIVVQFSNGQIFNETVLAQSE